MKTKQWFEILGIILLPVISMALGVAVLQLFNLSQALYGGFVINLFLLAACFGLIWRHNFSLGELGLKFHPDRFSRHVVLSLIIFAVYVLFYIFVIRVSALKPQTPAVVGGLITTIVVVIAEELFFRGVLYGYLQRRFSDRTALIFSSILFGLFHARQGLRGIVLKTFTGWLWGSVRYATGMIYLVIFPIHYVFNTVWLLFVGNWDNPPVWGIYALPIIEFVLGLIVVLAANRKRVSVA